MSADNELTFDKVPTGTDDKHWRPGRSAVHQHLNFG